MMKLLKISKKMTRTPNLKTKGSKNLYESNASMSKIREIKVKYKQSRKSTREKWSRLRGESSNQLLLRIPMTNKASLHNQIPSRQSRRKNKNRKPRERRAN